MRQLVAAFLVLCVACAGGGHSAKPLVSVGPIRSELTRDKQIDHTLSRLTFGARPGDAERVRSMGLERWIAMQLSPERVTDRTADTVIAKYVTLNTPSSELVAAQREIQIARRVQQMDSMRSPDVRPVAQDMRMDARRDLQLAQGQLVSSKLMRAVVSERQLYEMMVDFWANHFSVFQGKGQTRLYLTAYDRDVIRPHAMGRFRDLLGAVAKSPAMLFYLDNAQSVADSGRRTASGGRRPMLRPNGQPARGLNENYARELMELHTLGVDGGYTQQDVIEVARALTGWTIDPPRGVFMFRPQVHDAEEKRVLGTRLEAGRGIEDGEQVLDILAAHPSTAKYITRKLVVRFVSDTAPTALVDRCSATFTKTSGDIRETLRCVVTSPEFFSNAAYRSKVKTPFELVASALRATNSVPDLTPRASRVLVQLGQPIFGRQTPDGWPDRAEDWMNAGAMVNRVNFGMTLASRQMPGVRVGTFGEDVASKLSSPEFQRR
jgi:uncharacterized protein (DUF1800 family)